MNILSDRKQKAHVNKRCKVLCPASVKHDNPFAFHGDAVKCKHGNWFVLSERVSFCPRGYPHSYIDRVWHRATFFERRRIEKALRERPVSDRLWPDGEAITTTRQTAEQFVLSDDD